jgi:hypothetical protein
LGRRRKRDVDNLVILASLLVSLPVPDGSTIVVADGTEFPVFPLSKFFFLSLGGFCEEF